MSNIYLVTLSTPKKVNRAAFKHYSVAMEFARSILGQEVASYLGSEPTLEEFRAWLEEDFTKAVGWWRDAVDYECDLTIDEVEFVEKSGRTPVVPKVQKVPVSEKLSDRLERLLVDDENPKDLVSRALDYLEEVNGSTSDGVLVLEKDALLVDAIATMFKLHKRMGRLAKDVVLARAEIDELRK